MSVKRTSKGAQTSAGARLLRTLRERAGLSQVDVEVVAELGEHYLKRIELGQVKRPQRATLERILSALDASYNDRRHVLEDYGYIVSNPLPTPQEIASAQDTFHRFAQTLSLPAQLIDCAQRLLAWNDLLDFAVGRSPQEKDASNILGTSIFAITYDPQYYIRSQILNLDAWSEHILPVLLHELQPFMYEAWCQEVLHEIRKAAPGLDSLIKVYQISRRIPARPRVPIIFRGTNGTPLSFWVATEHYSDDSRFRVTYYFPADEATIHQCRLWVESKLQRAV